MIDHILGRPDTRFRKYQVFTVVLLWSLYLYRGDRHGPPILQKISALASNRLTVWQTVVMTMLYLYISRNFAKLVGLYSPEPLANMYNRSYYRATWVTTALDAGFWTAMDLRPKWFRDLASVVFSVYFLFCADQADETVRKVRGCIDIDLMRVSWNKPTTPYISAFTRFMRPRSGRMSYPPRRTLIRRPRNSEYSDPIEVYLYFDGPKEDLVNHNKIILDIPGGGFVAMDPRCHDDKLMEWAARSKLPVVAINYGKAPEHPFPYALHECTDAYLSIMQTKGTCLGLSGSTMPKVVLAGDSAGGNLAAGMVLMLLQTSPQTTYEAAYRQTKLPVPLPLALVLTYPALDMNITSWMTADQVNLMRTKGLSKKNKNVLKKKSEDYRKLTPNTPYGSEDEFEHEQSQTPSPPLRNGTRTDLSKEQSNGEPASDKDPLEAPKNTEEAVDIIEANMKDLTASKPRQFRTRLAMTSMISYFNDRVLSPELLRAMILLYVGEHNKPDFSTDYLLSPILAPDSLLARFPKVYMLTGERDPLSDDTVLFAGRLRQAKYQLFKERQELGLESTTKQFDQAKHVEYMLIPGISHGFLQFAGIFKEGHKYIEQCRRWIMHEFQLSDLQDIQSEPTTPTVVESAGAPGEDYFIREPATPHRRDHRDSNSDREDYPLEMTSMDGEVRRRLARRAQSRRRGLIRKLSTATTASGFAAGRRSPVAERASLVSLASNDDLLGRRMGRVGGGLFGDGAVPDTP